VALFSSNLRTFGILAPSWLEVGARILLDKGLACIVNSILNSGLGHSDQQDRVHGQADLVEFSDYDSEKQLSQGSPIDAVSSKLAVSANRNKVSAIWNPAKEVDWNGPSDPSSSRNFPVWRK